MILWIIYLAVLVLASLGGLPIPYSAVLAALVTLTVAMIRRN